MKKLLLLFIIASAFSTTATAVDIAISTQANWWSQSAADREMQEIVNNVRAVSVERFAATQQDALADWVIAHTGDGVSDLLILCGQFPRTVYAPGNTQANDSLAELFLDDGNCIVNTADYMFYVVDGAGTNGEPGLETMMDIAHITMWDDDTAVVVTAEGQQYTPSLKDYATDRPWHLDELQGDWYAELILAKNTAGTRAEPAIIRNSATGGRLGTFYQTAGQDDDPRGKVMSEWINNWYLPRVVAAQLASSPLPADGDVDVLRDAVLSWKPGKYAATRDVYFGVASEDVDNASAVDPRGVLVSQGQTDTIYDPEGLLEYGQTYYWRVDEVNNVPDSTVFKGPVWSFAVEQYTYPITGLTATASSAQTTSPAIRTIDGSGLNALDQHGVDLKTMWVTPGDLPAWIQYTFDKKYKLHELWVWNSNSELEPFMGFGAKDVAIEYSTDGETWTQLENVPQFAQGAGRATYTANTRVDMGGVMAKFVKLTINNTWGGPTRQTGLSEVRFYFVPVQAFKPGPADGAAGVSVETVLDWRPGREATSHRVYFGTDSDAVANGTVTAETVTDHSYTPTGLMLATGYFWRVDEIGDTGTYTGDTWSFRTTNFYVIDDFETYDLADYRIFDTWLDGRTNDTGATVKDVEQTIVYSGRQSMRIDYNNGAGFFRSEAEREFDSAQNWTSNGASRLGMWVRGYPAPTAVTVTETAGKINLTGAGTDIWGNSDEFTYAYKTLTGDGSMVARVVSNGTGTNTWAKGGVMIRDGLNGSSAHAMMVITGSGGNGASFQYRATANGTSGNSDSTTVVAPPYWVKITRSGDMFTGHISADGETWTIVGSTTIVMTAPIQIGLCVTSHEAGVDRTYQFDSIATTGAVTGVWQGAVIDRPQYNDAQKMYLIVQDSAGKNATVTSATAAASADWARWAVPMTDFVGVNMAKVKKIVIGIGDPASPVTGSSPMISVGSVQDGTGTIYVDCVSLVGPSWPVDIWGYVRDAENKQKGISNSDVVFTREEDGFQPPNALADPEDGEYFVCIPMSDVNQVYKVVAKADGFIPTELDLTISPAGELTVTADDDGLFKLTPPPVCGVVGLDIYLWSNGE